MAATSDECDASMAPRRAASSRVLAYGTSFRAVLGALRVAAGDPEEGVLVDVVLEAPKRVVVADHETVLVAAPEPARIEDGADRVDEGARGVAIELLRLEEVRERRPARHDLLDDAVVRREEDVGGVHGVHGEARRAGRRRNRRPACCCQDSRRPPGPGAAQAACAWGRSLARRCRRAPPQRPVTLPSPARPAGPPAAWPHGRRARPRAPSSSGGPPCLRDRSARWSG